MAISPLTQAEIQFVGVSDLTKEEQQVVNELAAHYRAKLESLAGDILSLSLMIKTYAKEGTRRKYSVNLKLTIPGKSLVSDKSAEWDIKKALRSAFEGLMVEIKHKVRVEHNHSKAYD